METVKIKTIKTWVLLTALIALFIGMFVVFGPGVYNDSDQYIKMHIHREPLYPLFLLFLRTIFGEGYLTAMGVLQGTLTAVSIWAFAEYLTKKLSLSFWEECVLVLIQLLPHFITKYISSLGLFISNSVMSEALCLPLFTLFIMECLKIFTEPEKTSVWKKKSVWISLLLVFLLSLTRTQMMLTVLMWTVLIVLKNILAVKNIRTDGKKLILRILAAAAVTIAIIAGRMLFVKSYNLVFNGHFINNTYGTVNTLTNILYASDREDGDSIKDAGAREFFYRMYDLTEESKANYKYAGPSWKEKAEHIEEWHDTIKYRMIEDVFYQTYDKTVTSDYITQNLMADETAGKIIAGILPNCFFRWAGNYFIIALYGLIRSIAIVHPLINWIVIFLYIFAVFLAVYVGKKGYRINKTVNPAVWLMGISLLAICANAFAVGLTIMALSRYMIYGFAPFYTAFFLLIAASLKNK